MTQQDPSSSSEGSSTRPSRGAFIVLEGVDRCGKTTQISRLVDSLKKAQVPVEAIRFPDRTTAIGKMINAYLAESADMDDHAIHLLFSANRWEAVASLKSKLNAGTTLVCDRYAFSGVAFTAAKPGMDFEWCKECDRGLPAPDAIIFLDVPIEDAAKRGQYGDERYERRDMQIRVRKNFDRLMAGDSTWHVVDGTRSIEEVGEHVSRLVMDKVKEVAAGGSPVKQLWVRERGLS